MADTRPVTKRAATQVEGVLRAVLTDAQDTRRLERWQRLHIEKALHDVVPLLHGIAADDGTIPGYGDPPQEDDNA